eukprot:TCONS_00007522-protein
MTINLSSLLKWKNINSYCSKFNTWWYSCVVTWFFGNTDQGQGDVCVRHAIATAVQQFFFNQGFDFNINEFVGVSVNNLEGTDGTIPIKYNGWNAKLKDGNSKLYYEFTCHVEEVE